MRQEHWLLSYGMILNLSPFVSGQYNMSMHGLIDFTAISNNELEIAKVCHSFVYYQFLYIYAFILNWILQRNIMFL